MKMRAGSSELREVMDIRQASEYLGISPDTLYKYASEGTIPAFKLGNRWRFKRSLMDGWMDDQSTAGMASNKLAVMPLPIDEKQPARQLANRTPLMALSIEGATLRDLLSVASRSS
jgi:excisionase family DNA binding protein